MRHFFLVNVYDDTAQALRLLSVLRRHYAESGRIVHLSGPEYTADELRRLDEHANVIGDRHIPDKSTGIITALNSLVHRAGELSAEVVSLLHPDMVPTDRPAWRTFLRRFAGSKKALTYAPIWPGHQWPSFCALHFKLPEAAQLFSIPLPPSDHRTYNEAWVGDKWGEMWHRWDEHAYPLALLNTPLSSCPSGGPGAKIMHAPGKQWVVHDYCPETSVVHTNDENFWVYYDAIARF